MAIVEIDLDKILVGCVLSDIVKAIIHRFPRGYVVESLSKVLGGDTLILDELGENTIKKFVQEKGLVPSSIDEVIENFSNDDYQAIAKAMLDNRISFEFLAGIVMTGRLAQKIDENRNERYGTVYEDNSMKLPKEWCSDLDITIIDTDGWHDKSFDIPVDRAEFLKRVYQCTVTDVAKIPDK